jgi:AraC-like DNA-binding protein
VDVRISPDVAKPLSPRGETGIAFNLDCGDRLFLETPGGHVTPHPPLAIMGPLSHRIADIRSSGHYRAFLVLFKATGFYQLFGISPAELSDHVSTGCDVIGRTIAGVHEQLCSAPNSAAMAEIANRYFLSRLTSEDLHPVHWIAQRLMSSRGYAELCELFVAHDLSRRQIERKFLEQIGITPKRYAKLARFRNAARLKAQTALSWTEVSYVAGYYDQTHLTKDFRELVGATPSDYLRSIAVAPETELWCSVENEATTEARRLSRQWRETSRSRPLEQASARRQQPHLLHPPNP